MKNEKDYYKKNIKTKYRIKFQTESFKNIGVNNE